MAHNNRRRDQKMDIKDLEKRQRQQLETESQRYDHRLIDSENSAFLQSASQKRKAHRDHRERKNKLLDGESDVDEEFKLGLEDAASKFGMKRKKKYMFTDTGIPIEPFNINQDIQSHFNNEDEGDSENDAWFESVRAQQDQMLLDQCQKQENSGSSESEEEEGYGVDGRAAHSDSDQPNHDQFKRDQQEMESLKRDLLIYLDEKTNETVNMAMKRLREAKLKSQPASSSSIALKKKNVRKTVFKEDLPQKSSGPTPSQEEIVMGQRSSDPQQNPQDTHVGQQTFENLLSIVTRLQDLGFVEVFTTTHKALKESLEALGQLRLQILDKEERERRGWHYKIIQLQSSEESEVFGPFTPAEMNSWREQKYFEETDEKICSFMRAEDFRAKKDNWLFIQDIQDFDQKSS